MEEAVLLAPNFGIGAGTAFHVGFEHLLNLLVFDLLRSLLHDFDLSLLDLSITVQFLRDFICLFVTYVLASVNLIEFFFLGV